MEARVNHGRGTKTKQRPLVAVWFWWSGLLMRTFVRQNGRTAVLDREATRAKRGRGPWKARVNHGRGTKTKQRPTMVAVWFWWSGQDILMRARSTLRWSTKSAVGGITTMDTPDFGPRSDPSKARARKAMEGPSQSWSGYQNQTATTVGRCLVLVVRPTDENIRSTKRQDSRFGPRSDPSKARARAMEGPSQSWSGCVTSAHMGPINCFN